MYLKSSLNTQSSFLKWNYLVKPRKSQYFTEMKYHVDSPYENHSCTVHVC